MTSAAAQSPAPAAGPTALGVDIPHVALLLPVDSSTFWRHAEALRDGFLAASQIPDPPDLLIRVYAVGEDPKQAVASYRQAISTGAKLVVGPLVRAAANAVAANEISVPTLLLNTPDGPLSSRPNLYAISLQIEAEARQAAHLAWRDGRRSAYTVVSDSVLLKRVHQSFVDAFVQLGGKHAGEFRYSTSAANLERLRGAIASATVDMAFLALDSRQARNLRAALDPLPLYASSQTYSADPAIAASLAGIRVLDMPWLLQPDHSAVMIYPRQTYGDADLDRLYALGIDAWRIGQALLAHHAEITLDGVTGKLTLGRDHQFTRELVVQHPGQGALDVPAGPITPAAPLTPPATIRPAPKP
ncbi:MAG TPA: penicillin-binding protein activator [Burkholderiales bacterium]|nr:penicillin-binding protein activator [Burkholderiales bacterium]